MTTTKLIDNNRRTHAAKVLATNAKKNKREESEKVLNDKNLNEQAKVIRDDIFKLREDLAEGYDLLKNKLENTFKNRSPLKTK